MKNYTILVATAIFFMSCGGSKTDNIETSESPTDDTAMEEPVIEEKIVDESTAEPPVEIDQRDPEKVVEGIIACARTGEYHKLMALCAEGADGDCKKICNIGGASAADQQEFKTAFANASVVETELNGDDAQVEILFGADGKQKETIKLVRVNKVWYIKSF